MSREKERAREREKYKSELGTALWVSERNMLLEIAEVLRRRAKKQIRREQGGTRVDHAVAITWS